MSICSAPAVRFGKLYTVTANTPEESETVTQALKTQAKAQGTSLYIQHESDLERHYGLPDARKTPLTLRVYTGRLDSSLGLLGAPWEAFFGLWQKVVTAPWAKMLIDSKLSDTTKKVLYYTGKYTGMAATFVLLLPLKAILIPLKIPVALVTCVFPLIRDFKPLSTQQGEMSEFKAEILIPTLQNPTCAELFNVGKGAWLSADAEYMANAPPGDLLPKAAQGHA